MCAHLSPEGKLNVSLIREQAQREFLDLLDRCYGTKTLIWDDGLSGPFGLICEYTLLKQRDVLKVYALQPGKLGTLSTDNVIFITRPQLNLIGFIAENIHKEELSHKQQRKWHIFFVPMKSLQCIEALKTKGVYGSFSSVEEITSCCIYPFDNDLLSMELENSFRDFYVDNDPTCLYHVAKVILMLQDLYGPIKRVAGKGDAASQVWKLMSRLAKEASGSKVSTNRRGVLSNQIDQLLLLDRSVDFLSPFVTQLTYEGLIDEFFGINNCTAKFPGDRFSSQESSPNKPIPDKKSVILNSGDEIFTELRDKNFGAVGQILHQKTKEISAKLDQKQRTTVQELRKLVDELPKTLNTKNQLATHTTIAEMIKEKTDKDEFCDKLDAEQGILLGIDTDKIHPYMEDCMTASTVDWYKMDEENAAEDVIADFKRQELIRVLRLISIQSFVNSGLKPKIYEQYKRDIVHSFGIEHLLTFCNMEKAGILKQQQNTRSFTVLKKMLKLIVEESNNAAAADINYVHSIYAPLSVRIIQHFVKSGGWNALSDVISLIPGATFDHTNNLKSSIITPLSRSRDSLNSQVDVPKRVLVFFIGGCTYAEISALRFLSQQDELNVEFVVGTTKIINGNSIVGSLLEQ